MYGNPYVPDGCPISPWEEEQTEICPVCQEPIYDGAPHGRCWEAM